MTHDDVPCVFHGRTYPMHDFFFGPECRRCGTRADLSDEPFDPYCKRKASDIPDVQAYAEAAELSPAAWVRSEEGTFNEASNHFACDECYIRLGMPVAIPRWVCP